MIISILDTDLYKLSMQQAVVKLFPHAKVRYSFINRGKTKFPEGFDKELRQKLQIMGGLFLTKLEKNFLEKKCPYLDPTYLDFLSGYRFDPSEVGIIQKNGNLDITIEGYWYKTILWEVPLMAIISELYFNMTKQTILKETERRKNNQEKASLFRMNNIKYADFGTRRRYSYKNQKEVINDFKNDMTSTFVGTSNVHFARLFNLRPIGTHAHEWFSFHAAKYGFKIVNQIAMEHWVDIYRGDLGIALTDTFTTNNFFQVFDTKFAKLYDGVRHDSGDPFVFLEKTINHYKKLGIDPLSKTIIFSDSLNPELVVKIANECQGQIKCSFGIGTNFTNDVGVKPLNMVIKLTEAKPEGEEWIPTIKLSDVTGKNTGDKEMIIIAKKILGI